MASSFPRKNGGITFQFSLNNRRPRIMLGVMSKSEVSIFKGHLEKMVEAKKHGTRPPNNTKRWYRSLPSEIKKKFHKAGLVDDYEDEPCSLGELVDAFSKIGAKKKGTRVNENQAYTNLFEFFGRSRSISNITAGDATDFESYLLTAAKKIAKSSSKPEGLESTTVSRRIKRVKSVFKYAVMKQWLPSNPFSHIKCGTQSNSKRAYYITPELAKLILDALPTAELRLIFALARWGGLRLPQEGIDLKWDMVSWETRRFTVFSEKNERYERRRNRIVPIFKELMPYFEDAWEVADKKVESVCPYLHKNTGQAFSNVVKRVLKSLGVQPWPKFLINLRASRSTEVLIEFGAKAEDQWIGHDEKIAMEHYAMVPDFLFDIATGVKQPKNAKKAVSEIVSTF